MQEQYNKNSDTAVFTFGRFNPPHRGHSILIDKIVEYANNYKYDHFIVPSEKCSIIPEKPEDQKAKNADKSKKTCSSSECKTIKISWTPTKRDPLSLKQKLEYMKLMFPNATVVNPVLFTKKSENAGQSRCVGPIQVVNALANMGYKRVIMVVGSDQVDSFKSFLSTEQKPRTDGMMIDVLPAGDERTADAVDVNTPIDKLKPASYSASLMRNYVLVGDFPKFEHGVSIGNMKRGNIIALYEHLQVALTKIIPSWIPEQTTRGGGKRVKISYAPRPPFRLQPSWLKEKVNKVVIKPIVAKSKHDTKSKQVVSSKPRQKRSS